MQIRYGKTEDAKELSELEKNAFPQAELASFNTIADRLKQYPDHFWILEEEQKIIAYVDGLVTDQKDLTDEMYERADMHDENGEWQMIFSVVTDHKHQGKGYASFVMRRMIADAKKQNRKGVVLTCKDHLVTFYERFGFVNEGISVSTHGNVKWNQMRLTFH